mgnify:CR=1 FL=1
MRNLTPIEYEIFSKLLLKAGITTPIDDLLVEPMDDGEMGSLKIGENHHLKKFGRMASDYLFKDTDGVDVVASLYLDSEDNLYELDVFKSNYEKTLLLNANT